MSKCDIQAIFECQKKRKMIKKRKTKTKKKHKANFTLILGQSFMLFFIPEDFLPCNLTDPDGMSHESASHLGLQCLPKYLLTSIQNVKTLSNM